MTIKDIQEQIQDIQKRMELWPNEQINAETDRQKILASTDQHFESIENDMAALLEQCKDLPVSDQDAVTPYLKELKNFVEKKFTTAEKELIQIKGEMNLGRNHAQAIRAYTKP